ncbi:MAG TPA: hypothetical protein VIL20_08950 [Sandaracinaceae bacterium]
MPRFSRQLALALLLSACSDRTQLIVVVDSDLVVPDELEEIRVTVVGPSGMSAEAAQALGQEGGPALPLTLGVRPAGEALGPIEVTVEGRLGGEAVVSRVATTSLVRGEVRMLYMFLSRDCRGIECGHGRTCTESGCTSTAIDPEDLPPWTGELPHRDAGAGADGGRLDGGPPVACTMGSECDDGIDCTTDVCTDGVCAHRPNDTLCTAAAGGTCDPVDGCQYPECTAETCTAGPCQTAMCVGDRCERRSLCGSGETCCAGKCVPAGCDDGNPCTDDSCGASGCEHANNTAPCDDGVFCNGADTCSGGSCSMHAGTPCSGSAVCDESADVCTGCLTDADCGDPIYGAWSACADFSDICDETGTQSRSVTTFTCVSGTCTPSTTTETQACTRDTDGTSCGSTTCGSWGSCGGFSDVCDETGTRSRTCTDYTCSGGVCAETTRSESQSCTRDTDGTSCGSTTCGSWGTCGGFSDICDETGTQTRSCTDYACAAGSCSGSTRTESRSCTRDTDGAPCSDGLWCTEGDRCVGGFCAPGFDACGGGECVCTPSGCQDFTPPYQICAVL